MPDRDPTERQLDAALRRRRPAPSRSFGADLRDQLLELDARARRPPHLRILVATYICSGLLLLLLAALGAAGVGPFGS
jgi:hypothetical protein